MHTLYDQVSKEMVGLFYRGSAPSEISTFEGNLDRLQNLAQNE